MENSCSNSSDDHHLLTETLSFDESTLSVLPVIVDSVSLAEFERESWEPETLLSIPFVTQTVDSSEITTTETGVVLDNFTESVPQSEDGEEEDTISFPIIVTDDLATVYEAQTLQVDGDTIAYIVHSQPQEGSHAVELEDGTVAYITLAQQTTQVQELETVVTKTNPEELPKRQKSFMCPQEDCGRLYTSAHHLKVHERTHTGSRPYNCIVEGCSKAFSTDYSRKAHVRTHTGEKPYKCPETCCAKSFKTSGDLQKHIRTHTGERPYVCNHPSCDKAFASATNYKNHIRIHSGEKPYACNVAGCNKRFTEYSSLYKHHMVHTQEKPYQCGVCGRSYRQASTLMVHKRTSHGVIEAEDGTEIVLGNVFTQKVLNSSTLLSSDMKKIKTVTANTTGEYIQWTDNCGSLQRISSEKIFIIEDIPEHLEALQHIQDPEDPDEEELRAALDPLQEP